LQTRNRNRRGRNLPAEGDRLRRVIDGGVRPLRRSREGPVDEVDLVGVVLTLGVVTELGPVSQPEGLSVLLTDGDALHRRSRAIALAELVRVGEGLDGRPELLSGDEVQVLDVVRV